MRDEILRSKRIGLNANRIHIKVEVPRKLYWADRLGLLIKGDWLKLESPFGVEPVLGFDRR